jgi:WD40 repeat protein
MADPSACSANIAAEALSDFPTRHAGSRNLRNVSVSRKELTPQSARVIPTPGPASLRSTKALFRLSIVACGLAVSGQSAQSADVSARIWNVQTGKEVRSMIGHNRPVSALAISPDGKHLVTGGIERDARIWNIADGVQAGSSLQLGLLGVSEMAFTADGTRLVVARARSGGVAAYDLATRKEVVAFPAGAAGSLVFTTNGLLQTESIFDVSIKEWDPATSNQTREFGERFWGGMERVTFALDGKARSWWALDKATEIKSPPNANIKLDIGVQDRITPSPSGKHAFTRNNYSGRLWDSESGKMIWQMTPNPTRSSVLARFSHDGSKLALTSNQPGVQLIDPTTGALIHTLAKGSERFRLVAFSPNSEVLATWGWDKKVRIWDLKTFEELRNFSAPAVNSMLFSPDGLTLVTGGDGEFRGN